MDGIEISNQKKKNQGAWRKGKLQILGKLLEVDTIKHAELKEIIKKNISGKKRIKTKLYSRNLIKGIMTWVVSLVRYSGPFLKWAREKLQQIDQRTIKLMMILKALHPRYDIDCMSRKERRRGLASIQDGIDHQHDLSKTT